MKSNNPQAETAENKINPKITETPICKNRKPNPTHGAKVHKNDEIWRGPIYPKAEKKDVIVENDILPPNWPWNT